MGQHRCVQLLPLSLEEAAYGQCRVPEECPKAILDLYLACTAFDAGKRPKAPQIMKTIEDSMLAIPGAPEACTTDPTDDGDGECTLHSTAFLPQGSSCKSLK